MAHTSIGTPSRPGADLALNRLTAAATSPVVTGAVSHGARRIRTVWLSGGSADSGEPPRAKTCAKSSARSRGVVATVLPKRIGSVKVGGGRAPERASPPALSSSRARNFHRGPLCGAVETLRFQDDARASSITENCRMVGNARGAPLLSGGSCSSANLCAASGFALKSRRRLASHRLAPGRCAFSGIC